MRRRPRRSGRSTPLARNHRTANSIATAAVVLISLAVLLVMLRTPPAQTKDVASPRSSDRAEVAAGTHGTDVILPDDELQRRVDRLLAAVNPELPENKYFSDYAKDKLRWMMRQHAARRLTVAFAASYAEAADEP